MFLQREKCGTFSSRGQLNMRLSVLVADDNVRMRQLCRVLLEREGHDVIEAADGIQVLDAIRVSLPEIIVMEADMPRLDGLECTRRLKLDAATQHIPILMISVLDTEDDIVAGLQAGVDEYLTKPFNPKEFVLRVRTMATAHSCRLQLLHSRKRQRRQAFIQKHLLEFLRVAAITEQLDDILDQTLRIASKLTGCRRISIMLPDHGSKTLSIAKAIGIEDRLVRYTRLPFGSGTAGGVFTTGQTVIVNSAGDAVVQLPEEDSTFFVSAPLISQAMATQNTIVGVLNLTGRKNHRPFAPLELQCIDLICSISASAINAILAKETREGICDSIVVALTTLTEYRDDQTGGHLERVTRYSLLLARNLTGRAESQAEIDSTFMRDMHRAVSLHDIGKVAIPDSILFKPGKLTEKEMLIMRGHSEIGARIIRSIMGGASEARFLRMAEEIAHDHHEWYNGAGYPRGLAGGEIPLCARIVAVADVYDAVTSARVYKPAKTHDEARAYIQEASGTHFDPAIVEAFLRCNTEFERTATELADAINDYASRACTDQKVRAPFALAV